MKNVRKVLFISSILTIVAGTLAFKAAKIDGKLYYCDFQTLTCRETPGYYDYGSGLLIHAATWDPSAKDLPCDVSCSYDIFALPQN